MTISYIYKSGVESGTAEIHPEMQVVLANDGVDLETHILGQSGRSLCKRWLKDYRIDLPQLLPHSSRVVTCKKCWRNAIKKDWLWPEG